MGTVTMNLGDFEKWQTGETDDTEVDLSTKGHVQEIILPLSVYEAGIGDIISAYVEHVSRPWWKRRGWEWKHVKEKLENTLNFIVLTWKE